LGTLFHAGCDELRQVSFAEALILLLGHLEELIKTFTETTAEPLKKMMELFMAQIPAILRQSFQLPACKL
jgi:hypothetical protein